MKLFAALTYLSAVFSIKVEPTQTTSSVVKPPIPADKKEELIAMLALAGKLHKLKLLAEAAQALKAHKEQVTKEM